jgi:Gpi18-like mannosyltransferase
MGGKIKEFRNRLNCIMFKIIFALIVLVQKSSKCICPEIMHGFTLYSSLQISLQVSCAYFYRILEGTIDFTGGPQT